MLVARFPPPLAGAWANVHDANRWLAPPANFQCPSGTIRIISSNNSRDAMIYSRFEVEDFANRYLLEMVHLNYSGADRGTGASPINEGGVGPTMQH